LLLPLVLGLAVDSIAGTAPWGTLTGVVAGSSFALIVVLYKVKALYGTTAPPDDLKHN
jgi:F0F1-type ATP synthase assembly protein I